MKEPVLIHPPPFPTPDPLAWSNVADVLPMGLLYLAESCRRQGFDPVVVQLQDAAGLLAAVEAGRTWDEARWKSLVARLLTELTPRHIGIQCHWSYQWEGARTLARWIKETDPGIHVTLGGVHAGALARPILSAVHDVDSIVVGEGETSYPALLRAVSRRSEEPPPGVLWRSERGEIRGSAEASPPSGSEVPLLSFDPSLVWPERRGRYVGLPFLRGRCPKPCSFCALNSRSLYPEKQHALDELLDAQLPAFLERRVPLYLPENFSGPKPLEGLAAALERHGRADHVLVDVHPAMITERAATALGRIGARSARLRVWLGVEAGSERVRRAAGRPYRDEELMEAFDRLAGAGITELQSSIMVGLPGETEADILASDHLVGRLNERGVLTNVLPVVAFPETALYRDAAALGLSLRMREPDDFARLSRGWHASISPEAISFETPELDARARVEATLKLRLRQRVRLGYRVTPELFRSMEHLPGLRVPGESEALMAHYEPLLRGPRFGGPVVPTRFWSPAAPATSVAPA